MTDRRAITIGMLRGPARTAILLAGTAMVCAAVARAAPPIVEIRAQTRLVLDSVRMLSDDVAELRGHLLDSITGDGIGGQVVAIKLGDAATTATTAPDGRFRAMLDVSPGRQPLELGFTGTSRLSAAQLSQDADPSRAQIALALDVEDAPGGVRIVVRATSDDQVVQVPVALSVGAPIASRAGGAEWQHAVEPPLAPLGTVQSEAAFLLTRKAAGGPGTRRIRAAFAGDVARQAASTEKTIELSAASTTTMTVTSHRIAFEDNLGISGQVLDEDGKPLARAAVTLASGDRRLAQGATGEDGRYKFKLEGEILGEGQWGLQVQSDPGRPAVKASRSQPEVVRVAALQPVPVSYTIAAFLLTGCAAGGFFLARAKPWRRLRRAALPADEPATTTPDDQVEGGLVVAKPGLVSTLRRPSDDGFSGVVRDTVRGRPVADAVVWLRASRGAAGAATAESSYEVRTGSDGAFALEQLPAGEWVAEVAASGHVKETFAVAIPHRGELRGVRVDLVPVRERVFQLYRRAAEPVLPEARLWGVWSPRQIVDHVRARRPTPALADLTDFVEEIYFSPRVAEETVLAAASEQVDRAIHERARTPGQAPGKI